MRKLLVPVAFIVGGLLLVVSAAAQDEVLDQRLARARNVAIGFDTGGDFTGNPPTSEDREAFYALRKELERSGRYWVVSNRKDAEILIAIRVRWAFDSPGSKAARRDGLKFRGERSAKADTLSVYDARYPQLGVPLWRGVLEGGLSGDRPALLAAFQADVERLAK